MAATASAPKPAEFRPEIQGLRAVGALLVATFHIWVGRVSGGVDVFFVISGYLILGSLLKEGARTGRIDLVGFAYRLTKRLLPAALFVILIVMIAAFFWLPHIRWDPVIKGAVASALYLENWHLIHQAVDYLARDELPSPFQHYWAIAIQGQFYVVFGIALAIWLLLARVVLRRSVGLALPIAIIFVGSLAYSIWLTRVDQTTAYFSTFTRLWEFALGGLLAAFLPRVTLTLPMRLILGWIGFIAVLTCGAVLQVATVFPGYAALWPTLGACCVIAAGRTDSPIAADRILASRPLAYIGDISYSLYLWHWPVLIFYRALFHQTEAGVLDGIAILALAILLSAATQHFIEQPFIRLDRKTANPWPWLGTAAAGAAAVLLPAGGWYGYVAKIKHDELAAPLDLKANPGALAFGGPATLVGAPIRPSPLAARNDKPVSYDDDCHQSLSSKRAVACVYGDPKAETSIAIVGGSHSLMWLPAFQDIAARDDLKIITITKSSCRFSSWYEGGTVEFKEACANWNQQAMAKVLELKPDAIFTTATAGVGPEERIPEGYADRWKALGEAGIQVLAMRDTPWFQSDSAECVETEGADSDLCKRPRAQLLTTPNPIETAGALPPNVHYIDLTRFFCNDEICPPVAGNVLIYADLNHITATYARTLSGPLEDAVVQALHLSPRPPTAVQSSAARPQ
jgi:peptidoglycan/LPS O-acetylase OafA/YrhL